MPIDSRCPFCHTMTEDTIHLFLGCVVSQDCWRLAVSHNWLNMNPPFDPQIGILQMLSDVIAAGPTIKMDRLVALLWSIKKTRNNMVFRSEASNPGVTLTKAKRATAE